MVRRGLSCRRRCRAGLPGVCGVHGAGDHPPVQVHVPDKASQPDPAPDGGVQPGGQPPFERPGPPATVDVLRAVPNRPPGARAALPVLQQLRRPFRPPLRLDRERRGRAKLPCIFVVRDPPGGVLVPEQRGLRCGPRAEVHRPGRGEEEGGGLVVRPGGERPDLRVPSLVRDGLRHGRVFVRVPPVLFNVLWGNHEREPSKHVPPWDERGSRQPVQPWVLWELLFNLLCTNTKKPLAHTYVGYHYGYQTFRRVKSLL